MVFIRLLSPPLLGLMPHPTTTIHRFDECHTMGSRNSASRHDPVKGHRTGIIPQPPGLNASTRFAFVGTSHEQEVCSLKGLWMCGNIDQACHVFDKMLQRHRNERFHLHQVNN
ncbi:hypothetical protein L2E82_15204 [Cichorium intybus]|uniref:Uncharacterized protein n=1 Tax=Cichorium intybus TaxID=13427 RepID=A0ACB9F3F8_CICIN|nr:hypothetical protein L2E82_15204 [Cichorium intybus]